jgi:hypothetical protein
MQPKPAPAPEKMSHPNTWTVPRIVAFGAFVLVFTFGCSIQQRPRAGLSSSQRTFTALSSTLIEPVEESALESLLRFQVEHSLPDSNQAYRFEYIFVSFGGRDPNASFIERLIDLSPPVRPKSAAVSSADGVFDKLSGLRGVLCTYHWIRWKTSGKLEVDAIIYVAGTSAVHVVYTMALEGTKWRVIERELKGES